MNIVDAIRKTLSLSKMPKRRILEDNLANLKTNINNTMTEMEEMIERYNILSEKLHTLKTLDTYHENTKTSEQPSYDSWTPYGYDTASIQRIKSSTPTGKRETLDEYPGLGDTSRVWDRIEAARKSKKKITELNNNLKHG